MELILHLGSYKTATTSLQRVLYDYAPLLRSNDIDVYCGTYDRNYQVISLLHQFLRGEDDLRGACAALGHILASAAPVKIVSEEMLLGDLQCGPNLYGEQLGRFFEVLNTFPFSRLKVIMTVRRLDRLLESHYLHNYAVGFTDQDFDSFYRDLDLRALSWLRIMDAIAAQPRVSELAVIPFELCRFRPAEYARSFFVACGVAELIGAAPLPRENPAISVDAYAILKAIHASDAVVLADKKVAIIKFVDQLLRGDGGSPPDLFGPTRRRELLQVWEADSRALIERYMPDCGEDVHNDFLGLSVEDKP